MSYSEMNVTLLVIPILKKSHCSFVTSKYFFSFVTSRQSAEWCMLYIVYRVSYINSERGNQLIAWGDAFLWALSTRLKNSFKQHSFFVYLYMSNNALKCTQHKHNVCVATRRTKSKPTIARSCKFWTENFAYFCIFFYTCNLL